MGCVPQVVLHFHVRGDGCTDTGSLKLMKSVSSKGTSLRIQQPGSEAMKNITQVRHFTLDITIPAFYDIKY